MIQNDNLEKCIIRHGETSQNIYDFARWNGGHDFLISLEDFTALILGEFGEIDDWSSVFFSFDELLAYLLAAKNPTVKNCILVLLSIHFCKIASENDGGDSDFTIWKMKELNAVYIEHFNSNEYVNEVSKLLGLTNRSHISRNVLHIASSSFLCLLLTLAA